MRVRLSVNNAEVPDRWQKKVVRRVKNGVSCRAVRCFFSASDVSGFLYTRSLTA